MKTLILTCNTGGGHNSTAAAIKEQYDIHGEECDIADALGFVSKRFSDFISSAHVKIYKYFPKLFDKGYSSAEKVDMYIQKGKDVKKKYFSKINFDKKARRNRVILRQKAFHSGIDSLKDFIFEGEYDNIICVHAFAAAMVKMMRKKYDTNIKFSFVTTDYTCSPTVPDVDADIYFIPHKGLVGEFERCGVPSEKIIVSGIPVRGDFYSSVDKNEAKNILGLPAEKRNILFMCGSMGCGPMVDIIKDLSEKIPGDCLITAICGTNEKLLNDIKALDLENVKEVGYTADIPLYIDASELLLTKPGGLTSTEGAEKHIPMLFLDVVGGCEEKNFVYFKKNGWADGSKNAKEFCGKCIDMLNGDVSEMQKALEKEFHENASEKIYDSLA